MSGPGLLDMPPEVHDRIFNNMPSNELWHNVRAVNADFNNFLSADKYWETRLKTVCCINTSKLERHHHSYDPVAKTLAVEREFQRWSKAPNQTTPSEDFSAMGCHEGTVDAVKLFTINDNQFCVSGARDHKIALWDLNKLRKLRDGINANGKNHPADPVLMVHGGAHDGWIWNFCVESGSSDSVNLYSCGWDKSMRNWRITPTGITELGVSVGEHAHLCLSASGGQVFCGTMKGGLRVQDVRTNQITHESTLHRGAVLDIVASPECDYVYTSSEDGTLAMHDRRTYKRVHAGRMPNGGYFQSMSMQNDVLMAHSSKGWFTCMNRMNLKRIIMVRQFVDPDFHEI
ncbi:hypothetical protein L596_003141 [Steinernema carpocapsae]|uniref:F-box domain-containing protein n=1 Tax=Steinernema carpocapsae TaxID=34508 RepID=A0A4U8URS5_STECR|nr:hypothetical protein L596_003141 [Steinernema carpocapsae]